MRTLKMTRGKEEYTSDIYLLEEVIDFNLTVPYALVNKYELKRIVDSNRFKIVSNQTR